MWQRHMMSKSKSKDKVFQMNISGVHYMRLDLHPFCLSCCKVVSLGLVANIVVEFCFHRSGCFTNNNISRI